MTSAQGAFTGEQRLVVAARAGCDQAFTVLVERYHAQVLRYFARQTADRELAADLTQETFLHAFRRLDRLTDDRPFAAWLFRIAHNNLLHEWRRQRVRRLISLEWLCASAGEHHGALRSGDATPQSHERDLIQRTLDDLSSNLREALLLHSLCGFSGEEVAAILGISPAAARQRIARAKEQFRRQYRAENGAASCARRAGSCWKRTCRCVSHAGGGLSHSGRSTSCCATDRLCATIHAIALRSSRAPR
jgi:RNA polymerase sigma-70 factor, ECF subfamily